jgi:hypothetical protein
MSDEKELGMSEKDAILRRRLRRVGAGILIAGLFSAAMVYRAAPPGGGTPDPLASGYSKRDLADMENIGGKSVVFAVDLDEGFGSLWHGRRLACTLGFISVGSSMACFFLARRLDGRLPPKDRADGVPGG